MFMNRLLCALKNGLERRLRLRRGAGQGCRLPAEGRRQSWSFAWFARRVAGGPRAARRLRRRYAAG